MVRTGLAGRRSGGRSRRRLWALRRRERRGRELFVGAGGAMRCVLAVDGTQSRWHSRFLPCATSHSTSAKPLEPTLPLRNVWRACPARA